MDEHNEPSRRPRPPRRRHGRHKPGPDKGEGRGNPSPQGSPSGEGPARSGGLRPGEARNGRPDGSRPPRGAAPGRTDAGPRKREGKPIPDGAHTHPRPQDRPDQRDAVRSERRHEPEQDERRHTPVDPHPPVPPTPVQVPRGPLRLRPGIWIILIILALLVVGGVKAWSWLAKEPAWEGKHTVAKVLVKPGMTLRQVAEELHRLQLLDDTRRLLLAARLLGGEKGVQVSAFILDSDMSPVDLLRQLLVFTGPTLKVRIPEGARTADAIGLLARATGRDSLLMSQLARDSSFMRLLDLPVPDLDGLIFPDTYFFSPVEDERAVLFKAVMRFQQELDRVAPGGLPDTLDLRRLVTLASIVQMEYQVPREAPVVASVYLNRLAIGMKLQADPTVQYLLKRPRRLYFKDLDNPSPYNTYVHVGLPPGPIGCPGRIALKAVLQPARTEYIYFVSLGDGRHAFSRTYAEHLEAKRTLDELRARVEAGDTGDSLSQTEHAARLAEQDSAGGGRP